MTASVFNVCVRFLQLLGKIFHLSYEEISVVFNLWVQGAILLLSALLPALCSLIRYATAPGWSNLLLSCLLWINFGVWGTILYKLYLRYKGDMELAFIRCAEDLLRLSHEFGTTYKRLNVFVFILVWLCAMLINLSLLLLI